MANAPKCSMGKGLMIKWNEAVSDRADGDLMVRINRDQDDEFCRKLRAALWAGKAPFFFAVTHPSISKKTTNWATPMRGALEVPHGTSGTKSPQDQFLLTRHHAQAPAVLDHSRTLPQSDGCTGPAFAGGAERGEGKLVIFDAGNMLDDALAVGRPGVDAKGEVSSQCAHVGPFLSQSASASSQRKAPAS